MICEDEKTGELLVKPAGRCPAGYTQRIKDKAEKSGLTFLIPRIRSREVDAGDTEGVVEEK